MCAKFDIMMFFRPLPIKYKRWNLRLYTGRCVKCEVGAPPHKWQSSIEEFTWIGFYCMQQSTSARTIEINYNHRLKCNLCAERLEHFNNLVGDISEVKFMCRALMLFAESREFTANPCCVIGQLIHLFVCVSSSRKRLLLNNLVNIKVCLGVHVSAALHVSPSCKCYCNMWYCRRKFKLLATHTFERIVVESLYQQQHKHT